MVVTNNDITQKNYKKLSIQVSLSGLSFCVFDTITDKVLVSLFAVLVGLYFVKKAGLKKS